MYKLRTALCQTHSSVYCSFRDPVTTQLRCASVFHPFRCRWISIRHSSSSVSTSSSYIFFQFFSTHFVITTPHPFFRLSFATVMWRCCYCHWMSQEIKNNQIDSSVDVVLRIVTLSAADYYWLSQDKIEKKEKRGRSCAVEMPRE